MREIFVSDSQGGSKIVREDGERIREAARALSERVQALLESRAASRISTGGDLSDPEVAGDLRRFFDQLRQVREGLDAALR